MPCCRKCSTGSFLDEVEVQQIQMKQDKSWRDKFDWILAHAALLQVRFRPFIKKFFIINEQKREIGWRPLRQSRTIIGRLEKQFFVVVLTFLTYEACSSHKPAVHYTNRRRQNCSGWSIKLLWLFVSIQHLMSLYREQWIWYHWKDREMVNVFFGTTSKGKYDW